MRRSQSAIEYLTTYGWAILIIGIALAVLYSLNLFNPYTYAPKASAGSCFVVRTNLSEYNFPYLSGACTNELPQYVAQFNGQNSKITAQNHGNANPPLTFTAWIKPKTISSGTIVTYSNGTCGGDIYGLGVSNGYEQSWVGCPAPESGSVMKAGVWYFVATTINSGEYIYLNNQYTYNSVAPTSNTLPIFTLTVGVGSLAADYYFNGSIADVQIYNTSLSDNSIQALYQEGIGGAPIDLNNLVGWWPLNGNPNDYSGNGNNGAATNVIYTSNWESGYSAP